METIEIGFVHTYPCFLSGDIRSYSQLTASLPFKRLAMRVLGPRAETLYMPVYKLIALLTILPLAYPALQKSRTVSLHSTFSLALADGWWTVDCCNHFPQRFAGCTP